MTRRNIDTGRLHLRIGGHRLDGAKTGGRWAFECPDWPEIARKHRGAGDSTGAIQEFLARAVPAKRRGAT